MLSTKETVHSFNNFNFLVGNEQENPFEVSKYAVVVGDHGGF